MADHITSKLNPDSHLILDQPLLRLPFELLRKNFKLAHLHVEKDSLAVKSALKETATSSLSSSAPDDVLKNVDSMLARMRGLKRKLTACAEEETRLHQQSQSRIRHLGELYTMQSLDDVRYEEWSRTRLDRLLVDYLLRNGYKESAGALAKEKGIEDLVDVETFVQMSRIRESLQNGRVTEALAWCNDNKKELRKMDSNLEFMLRFQQYIELVRTQDQSKLLESIAHAKKYLLPYRETYPKEVQQACGLLAFPPGTHAHVYSDLYSPSRWTTLSTHFMATHNSLLSLPSVPLLHIALSAGLSALKTPSCHSSHSATSISPTSSSSLTTSVCPICSTELNDLARNVPYAHHTKSHVESDLVLLPNGCVYGLQRLEEYSRKAGLESGWVKDLRGGEGGAVKVEGLKKVYIS
ncbi:related to macrophage erythroblast attacher [Phialocephala subalpina]|uniref:Related to macrophage erythroblast attacher n=1 Tax=Phialocephala subalpina TaxID=576137 RepID=A0A1L7WP76_9HELO|nr:related to macrophage erythroblast attacher [Phialocephala subalpina]